MGKIYWVDDDFTQMLYIIQGAISKLWRLKQQDAESVQSNIIIFGNAYFENDSDKLPSQKDEDDAYEDLINFFKECCMKVDGPNRDKPTYRNNVHLIENAVRFLFKDSNDEEKKAYNSIRKVWSGEDEGSDIEAETETEAKEKAKCESAKKQIEKLIKHMELKDGAVVGIDLLLLHGDYTRIKNKKRIISMELFNQLKQNNFACFLYSSETDDVDFTQKWKEIYNECYKPKGAEEDVINDVKIYRRQDFLRKGSEDVVAEVERLLKNEAQA